MNRAHFYAPVRSSLFGGLLSQSQVSGMEAVLDEAGKTFTDPRWLAYMLATAFHETGQTMQPIHERGGADYFFRMYDPKGQRPKVAADLGNTQTGDGVRFAGRASCSSPAGATTPNSESSSASTWSMAGWLSKIGLSISPMSSAALSSAAPQ